MSYGVGKLELHPHEQLSKKEASNDHLCSLSSIQSSFSSSCGNFRNHFGVTQ